jgi:dienelactone hydrolase
MTRRLRMTAVILLSLLAVVSVVALGFFHGWHIKKHEPEELASVLRPFFRIGHPSGDGPFPTVVAFHGCGGMDLGAIDWMDYLNSNGYATVLVNSSEPRGLSPEQVCSGLRLWGSERAGDVLVASFDVRKLPFVDENRLVLLGWSHGAWAIMDLLAMNPPTELPTNLRRAPSQVLAGVRGVVLFYPFCGFPAKARKGGWQQDLPVLMLMAGKDPILAPCLRVASVLRERNDSVITHVYPDANHAFDMREEDLAGTGLRPHFESMVDARRRVEEFLEDVLNP